MAIAKEGGSIAVGGSGGGGTLSEIYQSSKRLLLRTRDGLERLERLEMSSSCDADSPELSSTLNRDISQIHSLCAQMDHLWRSVSFKSQRDLWKRKIEQVAEEVDSLKASLDRSQLRKQKKMLEAKERSELFHRVNGDSSYVLRICNDDEQAIRSARNSSLLVEEMHSAGVAILNKYAEQREHLKRAQRKAFDVLNTVGLSNSVLKFIERRHRVDKWIKYTGMIATILIICLFWTFS